MKRGLFVFLCLIIVFINHANALHNPAEVYCEEMGYEVKEEYCVLSINQSCELWSFYNQSCGEEFVIELDCAEQGNDLLPGHECCEGLVSIPTPESLRNNSCVVIAGAWGICSDCGNKICEQHENKCNCPEDCVNTSMKNETGEIIIEEIEDSQKNKSVIDEIGDKIGQEITDTAKEKTGEILENQKSGIKSYLLIGIIVFAAALILFLFLKKILSLVIIAILIGILIVLVITFLFI